MVRLNKASFFIIILLVLGTLCCKKEDIPKIKPNYITKGCLPKKVYGNSPLAGDWTREYYYTDGALTEIDKIELTYNDNGLLYKKYSRNSQEQYYIEYRYDQESRVSNILKYIDNNLNGCYTLSFNSSLYYNEDNQINLRSTLYLKYNTTDTYYTNTKMYTFYEGTNNIKVEQSFNNMEVLASEHYYEYDTLRYTLKNLNMPSGKTPPDNNIVKSVYINHLNPSLDNIYYFNIEYNDWGYPIKITDSNNIGVSNYEYINCE